MAYKSGADGVAKKGKTKGKNLGDSGPTVGKQAGGKKSSGVTSEAMKAMGRNLARVKNQG
jgi:hypothetical protein